MSRHGCLRANARNGVILDAVARAAFAFDEGGYEVVLDGIVGPWYLDRFTNLYAAAGMPLDYVVLRASQETVLGRVAARHGQPGIDQAAVTEMHAAFSDLGWWETHVVDTDGVDPNDIVVAIGAMRDAGLVRL